ncbi:MAG TPA: PfkB family carbohydrate kinase [Xanthomonadaceae bacterium]|nr:PfkB family carbohydrate kinase [Xanthomonadaceae bacterium]
MLPWPSSPTGVRVTRVVVVGSFNFDHAWHAASLPRPGETRCGGTHASGPGGKGFNQAVAAARAGAGTTFVCALGDDAAGAAARAMAAEEGVTLCALRSNAPTGTAGIFVAADGANSIVIAAGANADLSADFVAAQSALVAAAGVLLVQLEVPLAAVRAALLLARDAGVTTMLDPAPGDVPTTPDLLALCDIITPNETEFAALVQRHLGQAIGATEVASLDDPSLHGLCRQLLPAGRVVVSLGAAGCFASHPDDSPDLAGGGGAIPFQRMPAEPVDACDTTGAGDAFDGALAAALALDLRAPFHRHLRFANRFAALACERPGAAAAMPRRGALVARFGE